jgi:putative hemolysin
MQHLAQGKLRANGLRLRAKGVGHDKTCSRKVKQHEGLASLIMRAALRSALPGRSIYTASPFMTLSPFMPHFTTVLLLALVTANGLSACTLLPAVTSPAPAPAAIGMANPASQHCLQRGGQLEMRQDPAGNEYGLCHLPDGRLIEEWALFRQDQGH